MRKYILAVILIVIAGVGLSLYLVPSEQDVMHLQATDVARNYVAVDYPERYASGDRSATTLAGMAALLREEGRGEEIRAELEAHLQEHPNATNVRKQLALIYRDNGDDAAYLQQMMLVAEQDPSEPNLKLLADAYNYSQEYEKQAETLRQLITVTNGNEPEYFADLAIILNLQERKGEARGVIEELKAKHPNYTSFKLTQLIVSGYVDSGQMDEAYQEAFAWVSNQPQPLEIAILADTLNYGGRPDMALQLITPHETLLLPENDALLLAYVNASINNNQNEPAYTLLQQMHTAGTLPAPLYGSLIKLALLHDDAELAETIAGQLDRQYFTQNQAIDLLALAHDEENEAVMEGLLSVFDEEAYKQDKPVLDAIIALIRRDENEDTRIEAALATDLDETQRLRLAEACARNQKEACFDNVVARYPAYSEMSPRELNEIVNLYIVAERQAEITDKVYGVAKDTEIESVELAAIRLAASLGDQDRVTEWLSRSGMTASTTILSELFFLANDRMHSSTATPIAEMLYQRDASPRHREYLISAYMRSGQYAKALPLLREVYSENRMQEDNYLAALTELGRSDIAYREELAEYAMPHLKSDEVSSERKLQLVYALINTRNREKAMPYINDYAKSEGGEWKKLYNQIHAVASGPVEVPITERSREFRVALARDPATDNETKRMIAFSLMEDAHRDDAMNIFFDMAQTAAPNSKPMRELLYLWGPRLNEEQIGWLKLRADNATAPGDRIRWGNIIANYGDDFAFMEFVTVHPETLSHPTLRKKYFAALGMHSDPATFGTGMRPWVDETDDVNALRDYVDMAKAFNNMEGAMYALNKMKRIAPEDEQTLKDLSMLTYSRARYSEAGQYMSRYMQVQAEKPMPETSPFEVLFYQASLMRRNGDDAEAQRYYQQLVELGSQEADSLSKQSMYYSSLFYLGQQDQAREGFYGLLGAYPNDKSILADFLNLLIEGGNLDEARLVANQYDQNSPYYQSLGEPMAVEAPGISAVESYQGGQEMRIQFEEPIHGQGLPWQEDQQPGWVEGVSRGYDSVVIAAKPGHVMRITPTSAQGVAVVANLAPTMSPEENQARQEDLRLQLLYARMELEEGKEQQALARVNQLKEYFPEDPQLIGYTASVENAAGNWPRALSLLEDAQQMTPQNEDLAALRNSIERVHAQEVKLDHTWRRIGDSDEQITTLSGRVRPTNNSEIGIILQNNELDASRIRRAINGNIEDFNVSRQRGEIYGAHYFSDGSAVKGALFANNDTAGAGVYYSFNNPAGRTELLAEYQKPYWDFVEAVSEEANRSRVGVKHVANLDRETTVSGELSVNQYNIAIDDNAASTLLVRANLVHRIRDAGPTVALGYGFDGEYMIDEEKRTLPGGGQYRTFPMRSREIHYPSVILGEEFSTGTRAELVTGWAFDRFGDDGPQVQGTLTQDITDDLEAQARASYGLEAQDSDQNATHLGGHLRYKF